MNCATLPLQIASRWPAAHPLVMLHSGRLHQHWARWSILARPTCAYRFDGRSRWIGSPPASAAAITFTHHPLRDLDAVLAATQMQQDALRSSPLPFAGGWIGYFSYDLGEWIEPAVRSSKPADATWPLIDLAYCPDAYAFDHVTQRWEVIGDAPELDEFPNAYEFTCGPLTGETDPDAYMSMVARTQEYIGAGDIFQANISQRFAAACSGSFRALGLHAIAHAQPWYGAHLELIDDDATSIRCITSISPELFLQYEPATRHVVTRPIKGTQPASRDARELLHSAKDAAELHMIIDLMRNDLGRVCKFGSIRVPDARLIETHPTVHHGVGQVQGRLREGCSFGDLLGATFPGGSITGAPKIRAMQIIDALEPTRRGPYCGAIGYISNCGRACLNIAIRTMLFSGQRDPARASHSEGIVHYSAGAGIVADSEPLAEYRECIDKTTALRAVIEPTPIGAGKQS